ncbi:hypothetical protein Tco_1326156 [Tanacetum coccineum]
MAATNYSRDNCACEKSLIPLAKKTFENAYAFEYFLKKEMFKDLEYVQSLKKEVDELQLDKNEFSNEYDLLLQECLTNNIMCDALSSMVDIDEYSEMACKIWRKLRNVNIVQIIIFLVDSGCTKHMTGNLKMMCNFVEKYLEIAESSSRNIDNSNMHTFYQPHDSKYRWTKDHPLEQVYGNPSKPVQTRRQLTTDPEMCMFALSVSTAELKNIKEAMADSAWIEAMQEELHQSDRLQVWELVDKPFVKTVIKLKWLWKNKKDEDQIVICNKARLVAKGYAQE